LILLDTTPLVALCDSRDPYHARAVRQLKKLSQADFATCEAVLVETCFHLPHRAQRFRLRALLQGLDVTVVMAGVGSEGYEHVWDWLAKYADHTPDWADACLAVLSGRHRTSSVWTYDAEFAAVWRRPDDSIIPLVK
jgi:predicted nucleic acid-binding protein